MMRWSIVIITAVLLSVALVSPSDFYINFASRVLIYSIFALSLNLLVGYAGLLSLSHSAFFGISGYCVALLTVNYGWGSGTAIGIALLFTMVVGALFGALALRARGIGFLMITLALGQIVWGLALRWADLTGGENGIRGIKRTLPLGVNIDDAMSFYVLTCIVFLFVLYVMYLFVHSPFGASLRGTRDQPRKMSALSFDVWLIRWIAFIVASFFAGIAGILGLYLDRFISPNVLSLMWSAEGLLMVIVGGAGTLLGPVVGAAVVMIFKHIMSAYMDRWTTALGILFVAIVVFMPDGLVPGCKRLFHLTRSSLRLESAKRSTEARAEDAS